MVRFTVHVALVFVENRIREIRLEKDITFVILLLTRTLQIWQQEANQFVILLIVPYGGMAHSAFKLKTVCGQAGIFQTSLLIPEVLSQVNSEVKGQKPVVEIRNVAELTRMNYPYFWASMRGSSHLLED